MKEFPLIEKHLPGLPVKDFPQKFITRKLIEPADLEQLLATGVEVFGFEKKPFAHQHFDTDKKYSQYTHSGLLIGYKPIEKEQPVSVDEIIQVLEVIQQKVNDLSVEAVAVRAAGKDFNDLINRLKTTKEIK